MDGPGVTVADKNGNKVIMGSSGIKVGSDSAIEKLVHGTTLGDERPELPHLVEHAHARRQPRRADLAPNLADDPRRAPIQQALGGVRVRGARDRLRECGLRDGQGDLRPGGRTPGARAPGRGRQRDGRREAERAAGARLGTGRVEEAVLRDRDRRGRSHHRQHGDRRRPDPGQRERVGVGLNRTGCARPPTCTRSRCRRRSRT